MCKAQKNQNRGDALSIETAEQLPLFKKKTG